MKKTAFFLLLAATPLVAADGPWRTSVLGVLHGGTVTVAYAPRPAWDVEAAVGAQWFRSVPVSTFGVNGVPFTVIRDYTLNPVDLLVTRHFANDSRFEPFVQV